MTDYRLIEAFAEFTEIDLALEPQKFEDYKSKYLDLHDEGKARRRLKNIHPGVRLLGILFAVIPLQIYFRLICADVFPPIRN